MMKKGQGLSLNIVIISVILLIVLVLLIFIVGKYSMKFRTGAEEAESSICLTKFDRVCKTACPSGYVKAVGIVDHPRDCAENEMCCERKG